MPPEKTYIMFGPRVSEATKAALREQLDCEEIPADFGPFNSGARCCELFPILREERKGKSQQELEARRDEKLAQLKNAKVIFMESTGEQPDVGNSVECVRFGINALKYYKVADVTMVMPATAYERQDRDFLEQGRLCSLGLKWFAGDLKRYGADRIVNFAPHSEANIHDWREIFGKGNYHPLQTTDLFAGHIRAQFPVLANVVIGAPDGADKPNDQGQARARELAAQVYGVDETQAHDHLFRIKKTHLAASDTECELVSGEVAGKDCIIIDDMSDGGSTLINAAKELKAQGARSVTVYFTHAICSHDSLSKLAELEAVDRIVTTDTIPEILAKQQELAPEHRAKVEVLSIGPQLAASLENMLQQPSTFAARADTGTRPNHHAH